MRNSFLVGAVHALLVLVVWLNYSWAQSRMPRAWTLTTPFDPYDLLRGRYVRLGLLARTSEPLKDGIGQLKVKDGLLYISPADCCTFYSSHSSGGGAYVRLSQPASYFIPQGIPDPSILKPGEELWVEVTVPPKGDPLPLRLGVKSGDGSWREVSLTGK